MDNKELIPILAAFGGLEFDPKVSISDWTHNEERETNAKLKRTRKLLQNINKNRLESNDV